MSDRIAVMNAGRVEQLGSPEELYDRPATRFVADFIGTTNLLAGRVHALEPAAAVVQLASGDTCLADRDGLTPGSEVELSVRPEAVGVGDPAPLSPSAVPGRVEQVAFLGTTIEYHVRTAGGLDIVARAPKSATRYTVGSDVALTWSPREALVIGGRVPRTEEEQP